MLKGHLPRVIYHQVYEYTKNIEGIIPSVPRTTPKVAALAAAAIAAFLSDVTKCTSHILPSILVYEVY